MDKCKIVQDLLPLYVEELTSDETGEFVREHLTGCEACAAMHRRMTMPVQEQTENGDYKKTLRKNMLEWTGKILLVLVLVIGLPLYFFWEIGAFGERTVLRSEVSGREFVVVDNSRAGLFSRSGAYVITPDGKGRNLRGDESFEELEIDWAPNGEYYFAWWKFDDRDEAYFWGDESVTEPDENGVISYSYWDRQWPQEWNFLERMAQFVEAAPELADWELGEIEFRFDMWSMDSERLYFTFTTENGYGGRVRFDCTTKEFTLQKAYAIQKREVRTPVEVLEEMIRRAEADKETMETEIERMETEAQSATAGKNSE